MLWLRGFVVLAAGVCLTGRWFYIALTWRDGVC